MDLDHLLQYGSAIDVDYLDHVYHGSEILLAFNLLNWLAERKEIKLSGSTIEQLFDNPIKHRDLISFAREVLILIEKYYIQDENVDLIIEINLEDPISDPYGQWLQDSLQHENRKTLASNYTQNAPLLFENLLDLDTVKSVCDHFCGSGNLIIGYLSQIEIPEILKVRINDLMPTAVLLAYCRIKALEITNLEVIATVDNGFKIRNQYDLVLINPPYTRSHRIDQSTKQLLTHWKKKVAGSPTGQAGLHFWATISLTDILTSSGQAFVVLPRAAINAKYSTSLKTNLLTYYSQIEFFEYKDQKAFSYGSELKELILLISKRGNPTTTFGRISNTGNSYRIINTVTKDQLRQEWNWGKFFLNHAAIEGGNYLQNHLNLQPADGRRIEIFRGIELYGPNIFFFPNKNWSIIPFLEKEKNSSPSGSITISNGSVEFALPSSSTSLILRQPKLYTSQIIPDINHYVLLADDIPCPEVKAYLEYIKPQAISARRRFREDWYRHTSLQMADKHPYGQVFIVDKLDLTSTPTLAYYTQKQYPATKNFYVVRIHDATEKTIQLLAAWLNSTYYLLLYLLHRREIGGTYGRMQIIDYSHHRLFPDLELANQTSQVLDDLIKQFLELGNMDLGDLMGQLHHPARLKLDEKIAEFFDLDLNPVQVHSLVEQLLEERS